MKLFVRSALKFTCLALMTLAVSSRAASPFAGFYSGLVYITITGAVNQPETPTGAIGLTVTDDGVISDGGNLMGTVNGANGIITWQTPNAYSFTAGLISGGGVAATGSSVNGNVTTSYRIQASNSAGGFGQGGALAPSLGWRNPRPVSGVWNQVAYSAGQFVAVGQFGAVATSADGRNWIFHSTPTQKELFDVDYGAGLWVAVGAEGTLLSSPDGIAWTTRSIPAGLQYLKGVAFGNSKFIVADQAANLFSSTDGIAWSNLNIPNSPAYTSVDFVNGLFIAGGSTGTIRTSPDGAAWNTAMAAGSGAILGAVFNGGKYFVSSVGGIYQFTAADGSGAVNLNVGFNTSSKMVSGSNRLVVGNPSLLTISVSTNGTNWAACSKYRQNPRGMAFGNNTFVAVNDVIEVSTNGLDWTLVTYAAGGLEARDITLNGTAFITTYAPLNAGSLNPGIRVGDGGVIETNTHLSFTTMPMASPTTSDLLSVAANVSSGLTVAVGRNGTIVSTFAPSSTAPIKWTNQVSGTTAELRSVVNAGSPLVFTAVGANGTILRSANALTWTPGNSGVSVGLNKIFLAALGANARYVAVGDSGAILTSPDGIAWTVRNSGITNRIVAGTSYLGKMILLLTEDGLVLRSTDAGTNWTVTPLGMPYKVRALTSWDNGSNGEIRGVGEGNMIISSSDGTNWNYSVNPRPNIYSLAHGNGRFVGATDAGYVVSTDAVNWQSGLFAGGQAGVGYGRGVFVGVGPGLGTPTAYLRTSTDGLTWKARTVPTSQALSKVIYANGLFVAVGGGGTVLISPDAVNWVNRTIAGNGLTGIAYGAGKYVAVGDSITRYSSDGGNWTATSGFINAYAVTFATNLFVAVGLNGSIRTSPDGVAWTARTSGTNALLYGVGYANGKFIAAAFGGTFVTSADGTNWTVEISNIGNTQFAIATGNGNLLTAGEGGSILQVPIPDQGSPGISGQPTTSQTLGAGQTLTLGVAAGGAAVLQYQWIKDGTPMADSGSVTGATTANLTITGVNVQAAGTYSVAVYNAYGSRLSNPASVAVNGPPVFTVQPMSITTSNGLTTNLTALATGPGAIAYFWRKGGAQLANDAKFSGVFTATLGITGCTGADEGLYSVVASNSFGTVTSGSAQLMVNRAPVIVVPPQVTVVNQGQTLTLTVQADGTAPLAYQWKKGGVNVSDGGDISGATTATLTIQNSLVSNGGLYSVAVSNAFVPAVTSAAAYASVIGPGAIRPDMTNIFGNSAVYDISPTADGEFLVGGDITYLAGSFFTGDAGRIRGNGSLNTNFSANGSGDSLSVRGVVELANGKVLAGGDFVNWAGSGKQWLVRLTANGALDTTFTAPANSAVKRMIRLADGRVLVATGSSGFNNGNVYRFTADGVLDGTFSAGTLPSLLLDMAVQSTGKIIVCGKFGMRILNEDGSGATGFGPAVADIPSVFVAPDDKVYYSDNGGTAFARLNADGTADGSFSMVISGHVFAMAHLPGGRLLIGGDFATANSASRPYLAMLETNGVLVAEMLSPYAVVGGGAVYALELLEDGSALVGGNLSITAPVNQIRLQRVQIYSPALYFVTQPGSQVVNRGANVTFSAQGQGSTAVTYQWRKNSTPINGATGSAYTIPSALDTSAGNYDVIITNQSGSKTSRAALLTVLGETVITQQPASLVVTQGFAASFSVGASGATPVGYQWRKNGSNISGANGSVYSFVATTNDSAIYSVEVSNNLGAMVSQGAGLSVVGSAATPLVPGTLNTNVTPGTLGAASPFVYGLSVDASGRILTSGTFTTYNGQTRSRFMRLNTDLSLDSYAPSFDGSTYCIRAFSGGGFAIGGYFTTVDAATSYGLAFFDGNGSRLAQPTLNTSGYIDGSGIFQQPDGKVLIGGAFSTVNNTSRSRVARVNANGSLDSTFAFSDTVSGSVSAVAMDAAGNVLISGNFSQIGSTSKIGLARLTTNGALDTTFTTALGSAGNPAFGFARQTSGKMVAYGSFASIGGQSRVAIARLNLDGSVDTTFNATLSGAIPNVNDVIVEADDKLLIAGSFTTVGGVTRRGVARLSADGALDTGFGSTTGGITGGGTPAVYSMIKLSDGNLVIGGTFTAYDGIARNYLAKLNYSPLPLPALGIVQQPQGVALLAGKAAVFTVAAVGTAPLTFQWRKGTAIIDNATNATFTLNSVQGGDAADYSVVVTDANTSTTSQNATLSLQTGQTYAAWLAGKGLTPGVNDGPAQDPDNDGINNLLEYTFGTNPNSNLSAALPAAVTVQVNGQSYRAVRFVRQKNLTDVMITVTMSSNVKFTVPLATTVMPVVDLGNGTEEITVRAVDPITSFSVWFFLTQVNQIPQ